VLNRLFFPQRLQLEEEILIQVWWFEAYIHNKVKAEVKVVALLVGWFVGWLFGFIMPLGLIKKKKNKKNCS